MKNSWGKRIGMLNRLSRVFGGDGRSLIIAADHRQRGIQEGMENFHDFSSRILSTLRYADALITTKEPMGHLITSSPDPACGKGLLLSLNRTGLAGSVFELDDRLVTHPETAVRWGLDGVKFLLRIDPGRSETSSQLEICGEICDTCERWDLPLIIEPLYCTYRNGRLCIETDADKVRYAAIIASDFRVPALKIPYPSGQSRSVRRKSFRDIIESVNSRVLVLGGKRTALKALLARAEDSITEGGSGLAIGRNVLLDDNPHLIACALRHIVHEDEDAETALKKAKKEIQV